MTRPPHWQPLAHGLAGLLVLAALAGNGVAFDEPTPAGLEYFESKVRPLFVEHCQACHSADAPKGVKGGLRIDGRESLLKGGDSGPAVVPGKPEESLLLQAVRWQGGLEMPPQGKLRDSQIAVLAEWVRQGAHWPAADERPSATGQRTYDWNQLRQSHWAWRPVARPPLPEVRQAGWCRTPIDRFILAGLEAEGLDPAPPAEPRVLLRRVHFDLIGLPPTPKEAARFESDCAEDLDTALEQVVERLLSRPEYGERWARHWLDVARYSDVAGSFGGPPIPHAWRYRDWVVSAFNDDLPYDEFVRAQIAGDLLDPGLAPGTGFFALGPTYVSDGGDPAATAQAQSETLDDRVDTLTRGLLGLTASCARCHDHKFDPIPQLDYYSLAGVFHNTRLVEHPLAPPETVAQFHEHQRQIQEAQQSLGRHDQQIKQEQREPTAEERIERNRLQAEVERLQKTAPPMYPVAHALAESGQADMRLAIRGDLLKPGPVAPRRFLRVLAGEATPLFTRGSGRLELADVLVRTDNPLTARVFVNRLWLTHFGQGLVRTPSNFGVMGERPTHAELLDWLAAEFQTPAAGTGAETVGAGWSIKRMHRLLLRSAAWRMSSRPEGPGLMVDGDNRRLWRANPRRLDVEAWRDSLLAVTGELDATMGGPPVDSLLAGTRRTLYGSVNRNGDQFEHQVFLRLFDFPPSRASSEGRTVTTVPQQYLFLMNSPFMAARARALARLLSLENESAAFRIQAAYQRLYSRSPTQSELEAGLEFVAGGQDTEADRLSVWEQYAQVLLSSNEMMFVE